MSRPIATTRPGGGSRGRLLKAAVVIPDLIIASLLWLMILALLPPAVAFMATILGITSAALAATGLGEDAVVRVLYRARRPTASEAPRLAVAWRIAIHHSDTSDVTLRIVTHGPPIATGGRRHLLLRRDIVDAYVANGINAHQMAALIAQGIGRLRSGHTRFDLLWAVWTIPWDLIRGLARAIGHRLVWIPLVHFAWRTRLFVGVIAVMLEAQAGRWPSLLVIAVFLAMSYAMPYLRRAWDRWLKEAEQSNLVGLAVDPRITSARAVVRREVPRAPWWHRSGHPDVPPACGRPGPRAAGRRT